MKTPLFGSKKDDSIRQVFIDNEIKANILVAKFLIVCAVILAIVWIQNTVGILAIGDEYTLKIFPVGIVCLITPAITALLLHGRKPWIKHMLMLALIITLAYLDSILIFNVTLLIIIPAVFSCWYYSGSFTLRVAVITTIAFTISAYQGACISLDAPDMNFYTGDRASYIHDIMMLSFLPRWMISLVIFAACYVIAVLGRKMVFRQHEISNANAKVETELEMAKRIQSESLPDPAELSECPIRDFDLAARMMPAREVGGDFYDFFYVDETHLALIIADVADKGIGAALYMMMSKLILANKLTVCTAPGQVLKEANDQLRAKSSQGMFVTVWLGILDLDSGQLVTANAGHEYPIIRRAGGEFEVFKDKHGFVLGGMDDTTYRETFLQLNEGDTVFVYTDGVPESNNINGEFFGLERTIETLNSHKDDSSEELISELKSAIDRFAAEAPQFDDTTMLAIRLQGRK